MKYPIVYAHEFRQFKDHYFYCRKINLTVNLPKRHKVIFYNLQQLRPL